MIIKCISKIIKYLLYFDYEKIKFIKQKENVQISMEGKISHSDKLFFGKNIYIGPQHFISGIGGLTIEDNVIIGPRVSIHTADHNYFDATALPYDNTVIMKPVYIEQNVWIGGHVVIAPGVRIGEGAVIGIGSVVVSDVPPLAVVGGNPAKVLKYREAERYNMLKRDGSFYLANKAKLDNSKNLEKGK